MTYQTTRSTTARNGMLRNAALSALSAAFLFWGWLKDGAVLSAVGCIVLSIILGLVLVTFFRTKVPLQIENDKLVVSSLIRTSFDLKDIERIGTHPKRGTPSLVMVASGDGHSGDLALPWKFIAEPQDEVVEKLRSAIAVSKNLVDR